MIYNDITKLIMQCLVAINPDATMTDLAKFLDDGVLPL